ncbi:branched-chain amino acid ABC transporter permease [Advenella mimigardefordensis]|uniref:Putative ABC transporter permease protein n=1 Tax=Advenella mimigardefordensis (strain DSM 17166 / LMG 22922 / DPN7) TaxID=1247726 RepID=W0PF33_ADVMD|nr:branched-chain amino acid ABC transporter permease [Advenella mimigardefordensis]AHG64157.1 putative ABC transporter permease protein [Advenella mimigardefordensis DPN7]
MTTSTIAATSGLPKSRYTVLGCIVALILLIAAPWFVYPVFVMKLMCYALFAAAFNLVMGYAGLLSLGHAAFLGIGAYLTGYAIKAWGVDPLLGIGFSVIVAALIGSVMGALAIRRKGIEFAMITLALSQVISFIAHQAPFTGGEDGLQGIARGYLLGLVNLRDPIAIYAFVLVLFILGMFVVWRTINSPFGHILLAIREQEDRAVSLGYTVSRYKLTVFIISAMLAALAGAMKVLVFQNASLDDVSFHLSGLVVLMALLGGIGTFFGPLIGAGIVVALESVLATSDLPTPVLTGTVFVLCVLLFRRGVVGEMAEYVRKRTSDTTGEAESGISGQEKLFHEPILTL